MWPKLICKYVTRLAKEKHSNSKRLARTNTSILCPTIRKEENIFINIDTWPQSRFKHPLALSMYGPSSISEQ